MPLPPSRCVTILVPDYAVHNSYISLRFHTLHMPCIRNQTVPLQDIAPHHSALPLLSLAGLDSTATSRNLAPLYLSLASRNLATPLRCYRCIGSPVRHRTKRHLGGTLLNITFTALHHDSPCCCCTAPGITMLSHTSLRLTTLSQYIGQRYFTVASQRLAIPCHC